MSGLDRRTVLRGLGAWLATATLPGCRPPPAITGPPIRVGVLHSFTGAMAPSEGPVALATRMAIAEWNGDLPSTEAEISGRGIGGRRLDVVLADGASDPATFAREARRLIATEGVEVIFGCWTSSSRKAVVPVVEELGNFLVYPLQYEGVESSPNVLYTGATPNQQLLPALRWAMGRFGPRVYFVGSDYVFPRVANAVMRDQLAAAGVAAAGERYLPLEGPAGTLRSLAGDIVADIRRARPDAVVSTLNGLAGNAALFAALRAVVPSAELPSISFSIGAPEARALARLDVPLAGDYAGWTWLPDAGDEAAARFWAAFSAWAVLSGVAASDLPAGPTDPMVSAVAGVRLWANARASLSGPANGLAVGTALAGCSAPIPGGRVSVDATNQHVWKPLIVGQFGGDGRLTPIFRTPRSERPRPYPAFRTRASWDRVLRDATRT